MSENDNAPPEAPPEELPKGDQAPAIPAGQEQLIADIRNQGTFTEMEEEIQELRNRRRFLRSNNAQQAKYIEALTITLKARDEEIATLKKQLEEYLKQDAGDVVAKSRKRVKL